MTIDENSNVISARDYYAYSGILQEYTIGDPEKYKFTACPTIFKSGLCLNITLYSPEIG